MNLFVTVIFVCLLAYSWVSNNRALLFGLFFVCLARLLYHYYRSLKVSVEGKAVLITGCASGFGHKLTVKLHSLGFIVFACCLNDQSDGAQELKKLGATTGRIHVLKMDVTNQEEVDEAVKYVTKHLPEYGLWGLVNNAGRSYVSFIEWLPNDVYEKIIATNLCGSIRVTKAFMPLVRKSQGRIVNVSSILGRLSTFWWGPYCITKHALEAFTDVLRLEMNQFKVKVCAIEPGNYMAGTRIMGKEGPEYSAREFWDKLDDSVQEDYGKKEMDEWIVRRMDHFMKLSCDDVSPVIDAMTDCIYRKYPKDRYFLASSHDKILAFIFQFTPTYFSDLLNLYFTWKF